MNIDSKEKHNEKFNKGDLVQVMNIKTHPLKNVNMQLIERDGVDKYGCDVWIVVYDYNSKTYTGRASTSCFNSI